MRRCRYRVSCAYTWLPLPVASVRGAMVQNPKEINGHTNHQSTGHTYTVKGPRGHRSSNRGGIKDTSWDTSPRNLKCRSGSWNRRRAQQQRRTGPGNSRPHQLSIWVFSAFPTVSMVVVPSRGLVGWMACVSPHGPCRIRQRSDNFSRPPPRFARTRSRCSIW